MQLPLPSLVFPGWMPFVWFFVCSMMAILFVASWSDLTTGIIPKKLTVGLALLGLIANLIRGFLVGMETAPEATPVTHAMLGLGWGFCGLLVGFGIFFILWILGVCGGGDVKLVAAVGAWLGPINVVHAIIYAMPAVILLPLIRAGWELLNGRNLRRFSATTKSGISPARRGFKMSYALSMTIGVAVVFLIVVGQLLGTVAKPAD